MFGNYPEEAKKLFKDKRGCFRAWKKHPEPADLDPFEIYELSEQYAREVARTNIDVREYARQVSEPEEMNSTEPKRLKKHVFSAAENGYAERVVISDRFHNSDSSTHKRLSCRQHNVDICSTLNNLKTATMESLNARSNKFLSSICTVEPSALAPVLDFECLNGRYAVSLPHRCCMLCI